MMSSYDASSCFHASKREGKRLIGELAGVFSPAPVSEGDLGER